MSLKCGIEIHQRLSTHKLFCNCSSEGGVLKGSFARYQHPVASELGKVDVAAQFEYLRNREFVYQTFENASCLVEEDEEPPHEMNREALEIAIALSLMLHANVVDEICVMRKTVIDGSNSAGFQRTALVATGGFIETSKGKVSIQTVCLEEESAGIVGEEGGKATYRLDRLGIPLIEIATGSEIATPEHAKEVAEKIGMLLRVSGKVQRGIGTIRQDVNVSVPGGARVEIKGAQELSILSKIVENEVKRQGALIELKKKIKNENVQRKFFDVSPVFSKTNSKLVKKALEAKGAVLAVKLPGFAGVLGKELCEGRRFGTELSDYAKAGAGVGGIMHSDEELGKYGISTEEAKGIGKVLALSASDAFVVVADERGKAEKALHAVVERAELAAKGVPEETRRALPDGTSAYMRPLPGSARMYPETDVAPVRITGEMIGRISSSLPKGVEEKRAELGGLLNKELAEKILKSKNLALFERICAESGADALVVATTLEETLVSLKREKVNVDAIGENALVGLFKEYSAGKFVKAAIPEILKFIAAKPEASAGKAAGELKLEKISGEELKRLAEREGKDFRKIMAKHRLRVDAKELKEILG